MSRPVPHRKTVAIFGGGIAGLSAAHELARLGHRVSVHEVGEEAGGFFRSARAAGDADMPSEYSWHGMGPWYHNVFDLLKQIPFDETSSVYDAGLSRPIDFGVAPDRGRAEFDDSRVLNVKRMFRMTRWDTLRWAWLTLRTWTADRRSEERYSAIHAAEAYRPILTDLAWRTWRASFGPWVGSDWTHVSLHQVGLFFRKQLLSGPAHHHAADEEGPAWDQGSRSGWLLLRGPSSEIWFDRWVAYLERLGVAFHWRSELHALAFDGRRVTRARLGTGEEVQADLYVLATNPFAAAEILERTPELEALDQLRSFRPLVQDGPHVQVSFRIAFGEPIAWPRARAALVVADSEFNITLFAEEQIWRPEFGLGRGVASLWTGTACVSRVPGRLYGIPLANCTKEQFVEEIRAQLASCDGLDALVREANGGRSWTSFPIVRIEVWHEWRFSPDGIEGGQPKWVNTTRTQPHLPDQATPVPNLALAGAHTRTDADVWSIEAAVESGRRAARVFEPSVRVIPQWIPGILRVARRLDNALFSVGAPHLLDLTVAALAVGAVGLALRRGRLTRRRRLIPFPASVKVFGSTP